MGDGVTSAINTIRTLGIVSIVFGVIGCGCNMVSMALAIIGLSKASKLENDPAQLSGHQKEELKKAKGICIAGLILSAILFLFGFLGFGAALTGL